MKDRKQSQQKELEILWAALPRVKNFAGAIDGGANIGIWSLALAKHFAAVLAFEPVRFSFENLRERIEAAKAHNVYPLQHALYDRQCAMLMEAPPKRSASTAYFGKVCEPGTPGWVQAIPIDLMPLDDVGLIKLDLEGAELRALVGAEKTLSKHQPIVIVERVEKQLQRYGDTGNDLHAWMIEHRYRAVAESKPNVVYAPC